MTEDLVRSLFTIVAGTVLFTAAQMTEAGDQLVFISASASGDDGAIHAYGLDPDSGELNLLHRTTDANHPYFMALSPDNRFLYSIHAPGEFGGKTHEQVAAYEIVGSSGRLNLLNRQSALGSAVCYVDVDATGRTVLVASYLTGNVVSLPVREDGSLGEASSVIQHKGSNVGASKQVVPHAHCIVVSPDNRRVYSADLGLDQVLAYRLESTTAKLSPHRQPFVRTPPGAGPRHLIFHPNGQHVYVINETGNSVTVFDYVPESGFLIERQTITTLPEDFDGTSHCADVKITPNGRFLYGTNRGHDSIAAYRTDDDGRLTLLTVEPSLGNEPQNLAITHDGELLLCANVRSNNVVVFRIDPQTGALTSVGQPVVLPSPSCIMIP